VKSSYTEYRIISIKKWDLFYKKWDYVRHKNLGKWLTRNRTTPSPMALFGHYLAKNHPTKNAIKQKYSPQAHASSGRAPALPDRFTIPWLPSCTADDLLHHEQTAGK